MKKLILMSLLLSLSVGLAQAQLTLPPSGGNQKSVVKQYMGPLAYVKITYNSPDVTAPNGQDRSGKIWGSVVPYGLTEQGFGLNNPSPWRAGANECTVIEFSHDVMIEGQPLAAGAYAFFIEAAESGPYTLYFNKNTSGWGSYFYEAKDDALTVKVTPKEVDHHEWLTFEFSDRQPNSTVAALVWEKKSVPFKIEVPTNDEMVVEHLKGELIGNKGFTWTNFNQAASFCLSRNIELEQGLAWAEQSISNPFFGNANFTTLSTKGQLLNAMGKAEEALATMDKAVQHPATTVFQVHGYGRQLLATGQKEKALETFKYNKERFGDVWPVRVGLARAYSAMGDYKKALEHCKVAHERAPDALNKNALAQAVEKLKAGEAM